MLLRVVGGAENVKCEWSMPLVRVITCIQVQFRKKYGQGIVQVK